MQCRVCQSPASPFASATVLGHVPVEYARCSACGFIQTQEPTWLEEAYSESITASDIGLVGRNLYLHNVTRALIARCFPKADRFLDYGGGYGMFVRLMRDAGFDFRWEDPFCQNLFAREHVHNPGDRYPLLTAFEVFEHLPHPAAAVAQMLERADSIFFSTDLLPPGPPKPSEWWYYALDSGQHVALYTLEALVQLGKPHGLQLYSNGRNLHLLTKQPVSKFWFRLACSGRLAPLLARWGRHPSLIGSDHTALLRKLQATQAAKTRS